MCVIRRPEVGDIIIELCNDGRTIRNLFFLCECSSMYTVKYSHVHELRNVSYIYYDRYRNFTYKKSGTFITVTIQSFSLKIEN